MSSRHGDGSFSPHRSSRIRSKIHSESEDRSTVSSEIVNSDDKKTSKSSHRKKGSEKLKKTSKIRNIQTDSPKNEKSGRKNKSFFWKKWKKDSDSKTKSKNQSESQSRERTSEYLEILASCFRQLAKQNEESSEKDSGKRQKKDNRRRFKEKEEDEDEDEDRDQDKGKKRHWWRRRKKKNHSDTRKKQRNGNKSQLHSVSETDDEEGNSSTSRRISKKRRGQSSLKSRSRGASATPSDTDLHDSKKVKFNESVQIQEIPNKDATDQEKTHQPNSDNSPAPLQTSEDSAESTHSHTITAVDSDQNLLEKPKTRVFQAGDPIELDPDAEPDPPPGVLGLCPTSTMEDLQTNSTRDYDEDPLDGFSVKSIKSVMLDKNANLFEADKKYFREELISMMERLVGGVNNRESLKSRYEEEITRLFINNEYKTDKLKQTKQKFENLLLEQKNLDSVIKENFEKMSQNFLQLTRERKRIAGAIDLREDFDKHLQAQISTKTKFVKDYAQILGKLEGLVEDTSLQWLQRETMFSTEAEALERVHRSVEKEHRVLKSEMENHENLLTKRVTQNTKLNEIVEVELKKYAKKQQKILNFNEKRIRALEGCIRSMQLDREMMYEEIGENRHRLKDLVNGQINALMDKIHQFQEILKTIRDEIESIILTCKSETVAVFRVSPAIQTFTKYILTLDLTKLEEKVKNAKCNCDKAEAAFKKKKNQKQNLIEIRRSFVENQRQQMLNSQEEYFLMEPVEVPGSESNSNFERSFEDFSKIPRFESVFAKASNFLLNQEKSSKIQNSATKNDDFSEFQPEFGWFSKTVDDSTSIENSEKFPEVEKKTLSDENVDQMQILRQPNKDDIKPENNSSSNRRKSFLATISINPKNAVGNAFKKFSNNIYLKKDRSSN